VVPIRRNILARVLTASFLFLIVLCAGFVYIVVYGIPYPENKDSIFPNYNLEQAVRKQINKPDGKILPEDCVGILVLDLSFSDYNVDLEGVQYFVDLEKLTICAGKLEDLSAVANLAELKYLDASLNEIRDVTPLAELQNLEFLNLRDNHIQDISPLLDLENLRYVDLTKNNIKNLELLKNKHELRIEY
jgi:internalin A/internalin B